MITGLIAEQILERRQKAGPARRQDPPFVEQKFYTLTIYLPIDRVMTMDRDSNCETAESILDAAQKMLYKAGYNAFSYRDISEIVGIKTSSIHYHFPAKADLATALAKRWRKSFASALLAIDIDHYTPSEKLKALFQSFSLKFKECCSVCPCSMLSTDFANIPESARREVRASWEDAERWIAVVLDEGRRSGEFHFEGDPESVALSIFASIEGATISASTFSEGGRMETVLKWIYDNITT